MALEINLPDSTQKSPPQNCPLSEVNLLIISICLTANLKLNTID